MLSVCSYGFDLHPKPVRSDPSIPSLSLADHSNIQGGEKKIFLQGHFSFLNGFMVFNFFNVKFLLLVLTVAQ